MAKGAPVKPGDKLQIGYAKYHAGQEALDRASKAFLYGKREQIGKFFVCAHRGWQKSTFVLRKSLEAIRSGHPMGWYAPNFVPIRNAWENLWALALGRENFEQWINRSSNILSIPGCGQVFFYSLVEMNSAAGPTFPFIVGDEWGALPDGRHTAIIDPILEKGLAAYGKAEAWFVGTPNREGNPKNDFWYLLNQAMLPDGHQDRDPDAMGWLIPLPGRVVGEQLVSYPSPYANPSFPFERAERGYRLAKRKITWRIEWLCEFLLDEGGQFEQDAVESQCVLPYTEQLFPIPKPIGESGEWTDRVFRCLVEPGHIPGNVHSWYQIGIDLGTTNDRTAIGVLDRNTMKQVFQLHFLPEGKHRWHCVYEAIALVMRLFPGICFVDITGKGGKTEGNAVLEHLAMYYNLAPQGVFFDRTNKPILLDNASALLEGGKVRLFNDTNLKFELSMMQRKARASGGYDIAAPTQGGVHDDLPIMFALMVKDVKPLMSSDGVAYASHVPAQILRDPIASAQW